MRVKVKIVVFSTDANVWGYNYCSYCPAINYPFGRANSIEEVIADVQSYLVILYKKYTSLKLRELEELPRFRVMSWQPFQLPWSALLCLFG